MRMLSRILASRAPIGSSISMAFGWRTRARPIATRCMSPPDSADGFRFRELVDADRPRHRLHPRIDDTPALAARAQRECDVVVGGEMRIERKELEYKRDVPVCGTQMLHGLAIDHDVPAVDLLEFQLWHARWWFCRSLTGRATPRIRCRGYED